MSWYNRIRQTSIHSAAVYALHKGTSALLHEKCSRRVFDIDFLNIMLVTTTCNEASADLVVSQNGISTLKS